MSEDQSKSVKKLPVFERAPYSEELFTDDYKKIFDSHPAHARHFIKQYLLSGSIAVAAKNSNLQTTVTELHGDQRTVAEILNQNQLSAEDLVLSLKSCIEANTIMRDNKGNIHHGVNLQVRLAALRLAFLLHGHLSDTTQRSKNLVQSALELFEKPDGST